jgi:hypothetical protein
VHFFVADHGAGVFFEVDRGIFYDFQEGFVEAEGFAFMVVAFAEDVFDGVVMALFDGGDFEAGMAVVESGDDFACLLGVEQGFGGLGFEKLDDGDAVWPGDHEGVVGIADDACQFKLHDGVEELDSFFRIKVSHVQQLSQQIEEPI